MSARHNRPRYLISSSAATAENVIAIFLLTCKKGSNEPKKRLSIGPILLCDARWIPRRLAAFSLSSPLSLRLARRLVWDTAAACNAVVAIAL